MLGMFRAKPIPQCHHQWAVTDVRTRLDRDTPKTFRAEEACYATCVFRICKKCLKKEHHEVTGKIDYSKAYDIYGGHNA